MEGELADGVSILCQFGTVGVERGRTSINVISEEKEKRNIALIL